MELEDIFLQKVCKMLVPKGEMPVESSKFSPGTPVLNYHKPCFYFAYVCAVTILIFSARPFEHKDSLVSMPLD